MILHSILAFLAPLVGFMPAEKKIIEQPAVDPKSIDGFIAWCEGMPSDGTYQWADPSNCLIAQWGKSLRGNKGRPYSYACMGCISKWTEYTQFELVVVMAICEPRTFGAAAQRARAYKKKHGL